MKVSYNKTKLIPTFTMEDSDMADANQIQSLLQHKGWSILCSYYIVARESIIDAIKNGSIQESTAVRKAAILKGFDEAIGVPERLVQQALAIKKQIKEEENDGQYGADE